MAAVVVDVAVVVVVADVAVVTEPAIEQALLSCPFGFCLLEPTMVQWRGQV